MRLTDFAKHHNMYALTLSEYNFSNLLYWLFRFQMCPICRYELIMIKHMIYSVAGLVSKYLLVILCLFLLVGLVFAGVFRSIWNHITWTRTIHLIYHNYHIRCCKNCLLSDVKCALFFVCLFFFLRLSVCVGLMQLAVATSNPCIRRRIRYCETDTTKLAREKNVVSPKILCFVQCVFGKMYHIEYKSKVN